MSKYDEYKNLRCKLGNILIDFLDHEGELVQLGEFDNEFMEYRIDEIIKLFKKEDE